MFWPQAVVLSSSAAAARRITRPGKRLAVYRRETIVNVWNYIEDAQAEI